MKKNTISLLFLLLSIVVFSQHKIERLDRGIYACRNHANNGNFISWRIFGTEWADGEPTVSFNVYRDGTLLTESPINKSNYLDSGASSGSTYTIKTVINGNEVEEFEASVWSKPWWGIKLNVPSGGTTPSGDYTYTPNDMSVGDVDGDGQLEYILKWDPTNSQDNSKPGYTGNVLLDCYEFDGTHRWRIDLGKNIRAGAHYTQFMVYDLDSDGKAEIACKTAPGTKDGTGSFLGKGPASSDNDNSDYRNSSGYILSGPEYLTVFNGETGAEMATVNYEVSRGTVGDWGDTYGNRVDRFNACVAYLDGKNPSLIQARGYYTRTAIVAWDWDGSTLTKRWTFDTGNNSSDPYYGQGNHNVSVGDLDGDGKDEIQFGAMAVDHDGTGLYSTKKGHGDAGHLSDLDPSRPGLEFFMPREHSPYGAHLCDPSNGEILWQTTSGDDNGRGVCYDVDENHLGAECWSFDGKGMFDIKGNVIHSTLPTTAGGGVTINFGVWWDGDLMRELYDRTVITKYNASSESTARTYTMYNDAGGVGSNNGTKSNPCLSGDILGDWREEIILRSSDYEYIYIFTTTAPTDYNYYTLLHDIQYREAIAWQNVGYNQPPHPSFYLGTGMDAPPAPNLEYTTGTPDCTGIIGGGAEIDECGRCTGGSTGLYPCAQLEEGYYKIKANTNNLCLSSVDDFTQQECQNLDKTQVWKIEKSGDNYKIFSIAENKYLTYETTADKADISFEGTNNTFYFETDQEGDYIVVAAENNEYVLDVTACYETVGHQMTLYSRQGNECQQFTIEPAETLFDCDGVWEGEAYIDDCGECASGTTDNDPCNAFQAEELCDGTGWNESNNPGYFGEGFFNYTNELNSTANWNLYSPEAKTVDVIIRFCNGGGTARSLAVSINGTDNGTITAVPTGSWQSWETETVSLALSKGANNLVLTATTSDGGPNIDMFEILDNDVVFSGCEEDCNGIIGGGSFINNCGDCVERGSPEIITCKTTQTISLTKGWNLFSTNHIADDQSISTILPNATVVKTLDDFYDSSQPAYLNSLQNIVAGKGYLVYNTIDEIITITGIPVEMHGNVSLQTGWNLIGVPFSESASFEDAFGEELENIQIIKDFEGFWENGSTLYSLEKLEPGKAYFILK